MVEISLLGEEWCTLIVQLFRPLFPHFALLLALCLFSTVGYLSNQPQRIVDVEILVC